VNLTPPRKLLVLSGTAEFVEKTGLRALRVMEEKHGESLPLRSVVAKWRWDRPPPSSQWMGQDLDVALLFADQLNFLDTFGAVCGALRGGGVLMLCTPPLDEWKETTLGWQWCQQLDLMQQSGHDAVAQIDEGDAVGETWIPPFLPTPRPPQDATRDILTPTRDQQELIEAVLRTSSSSPLFVSGRRGRGKSAALGVAAALLLRRGCDKIVVTSPSLESTQQLFNSAERAARAAKVDVVRKAPGLLQIAGGHLQFFSVGDLLSQARKVLKTCQYLFVDEAAGIPVFEASTLLRRAKRVIMATTLDGYEGSGQGFLLRALPVFQETKRQLRQVQLREPLRWAPGFLVGDFGSPALFASKILQSYLVFRISVLRNP